MNWTVFAPAVSKALTGIAVPSFLFGEVVQSWVSSDENFVRRVNFLKPFISLYGPKASVEILAGQDTSATAHDIDLDGYGGFQVCCDKSYLFLSIYTGKRNWDIISRECEKTIESPDLVMNFSLFVGIMLGDKTGSLISQNNFFAGHPVWGTTFPNSSLCRRSL